MKILLTTLILALSIKAEEVTYLSIGTWPDNVKLVCIDGLQWIQESTEDEIIINKLYTYNARTEKDETLYCTKEQLDEK